MHSMSRFFSPCLPHKLFLTIQMWEDEAIENKRGFKSQGKGDTRYWLTANSW